ncbi:MAG: phosphoribosyltransferase family protein [Pseudonocardia sp.]|nr:phosphoribosyltransferase family protein [Pseudonocardia sp.]
MTAGAAPDRTEAAVLGRLGVRLLRAGEAAHGADPATLLGLALRRNPRRAHLLVSRMLGKHVPTDPRLVRGAAMLLGGLVADALAGRPTRTLPVDLLHCAVRGDPGAAVALHRLAGGRGADPAGAAVVLGYAETATALGHGVAEALQDASGSGAGVDYLHSTRRPVGCIATAGGFTEAHSHAAEHLLLPADPALLCDDRPLVLVDDELSTGTTVLNTIAALQKRSARRHYVVAALVDARPADGALVEHVRDLGARLDVVSLARAEVTLPSDLIRRADAVRSELDSRGAGLARAEGAAPPGGAPEPDRRLALAELGLPGALPTGGRHGFTPADHRTLSAALPGLVDDLVRAGRLHADESTLVLGTEELMALPLRVAQTLADAGHRVAFSSTTRSPAVVVDEPDYALTSGITFPAHDDPVDGPGPRFAYNLGRAGVDPPWDTILVVVDPPADTGTLRTGLLRELAPLATRIVLVVTP